MKVPISYTEAKQRHPEEVAAAVRALRASGSKHRTEAPSKLEWEYSIAVERVGLSTQEILSGAFKSVIQELNQLSLEERIRVELTHSKVSLLVSKGHWRHATPIQGWPPEWEKHVREEFTKARAERDAYEALPETEKETRKREALSAVRGQKGFFSVKKPDEKD